MQTIGDKCEVHVMLRGLVDVDREIGRLQEKITKLSIQLDKLQTAMATEGYEQKVHKLIHTNCLTNCPSQVPENVQQAEKEKVK